MRDYRKLEVWQAGKRFAVECYRLTREFPKEEVYGLTGQIRRSSVSVPANIAEGCGRDSESDFLRFLRIALGSLNETETLMEISTELGYLNKAASEEIENQARDLGVRLRNLANKVESDIESKKRK